MGLGKNFGIFYDFGVWKREYFFGDFLEDFFGNF